MLKAVNVRRPEQFALNDNSSYTTGTILIILRRNDPQNTVMQTLKICCSETGGQNSK